MRNERPRRQPICLNVSRPTLIRLLEEGKIEFHKVKYRRVPIKSALSL